MCVWHVRVCDISCDDAMYKVCYLVNSRFRTSMTGRMQSTLVRSSPEGAWRRWSKEDLSIDTHTLLLHATALWMVCSLGRLHNVCRRMGGQGERRL